MSDIERYLSELRSRLTELDPRRANEIINEARTHLEARATQLEAEGKSQEEACAEAVRTFGEPQRIAWELLQGNARHQRPDTLRALGSIVISLGAAFAFAKLTGTPESRESLSFRLFSSLTGLSFEYTGALLLVIALIPAALLAGMVGGRRFWWLASIPGLFWIAFCWVSSLVSLKLFPYLNWREQLVWALVLPGGCALALAGVGWFGRQILKWPRLVDPIGVLCGFYVIWLVLRALGRSFNNLDAFGIALVVVQPALLIILAAAFRDRLLKRQQFLRACIGVCALTLLIITLWVALIYSAGAGAIAFGDPYSWFLIAIAESAVGLIAVYRYWLIGQHIPSDNDPPMAIN